MMHFANIYLLLLIPPVVYLMLRKRKVSHLKFSSVVLMKSSSKTVIFKHRIGRYILVIALILLIVALARPQIEKIDVPDYESGVDIALILDVSGSMESVDFEPNRLEVAKDTIANFIDGRVGDRLSFIVFAGSAYTKIPLTLDHHIVEQSLESVSVTSVNEGGTAIGMAISVGINRLKKSEAASRVMILVTDGENNVGSINPETASELAKELDIKIYTIGVGTDETILPVQFFGQTKYQTYEGGLDEALLTYIADTTGGEYYRAQSEKSLGLIFEEIDQLEKTDFEAKDFKHYDELAYGFIKVGLLLLLIGFFLDQYYYIQIP